MGSTDESLTGLAGEDAPTTVDSALGGALLPREREQRSSWKVCFFVSLLVFVFQAEDVIACVLMRRASGRKARWYKRGQGMQGRSPEADLVVGGEVFPLLMAFLFSVK